MEIIHHTNSSGLNCLLIEDPSTKSSSVQFWFRAGSALETSGEQGIAHFLEHMFFKGTKKRPGNKVASDVESFGGEINAFTSFDFTCYYINSPGSQTAKSTEILCDMVCNPLFEQQDIHPEKQVVLEEFKRSYDSPSSSNFTKIQKQFFSPGYDHQILGSERTINSFSRNQLVKFRNKFYNKENALLIIAGPSREIEKAKKIANRFSLPSGKKSYFKELTVKKCLPITEKKPIAMTTLTLVAQASSYESNNAPMEDFIMGVLGFGESSRLYSNLVIDKNIAISANSSSMFMSKGGAHFIKITFESKKLKKVIASFLDVLKNLIIEGLSDTEVERLKKQYLSSKIYDLETTESYAFSKGHGYAQNGDINSEEKFIERFQSITTDMLNKALTKILPKEWNIILQLPEENKDKFISTTLKKFKADISKIVSNTKRKVKNEKKFSKFDDSLTHHSLKEGIHLIHKQNSKVKTFSFHTYIKGGLTDENIRTSGSYHFISSLLNASSNEMSKIEIKNYFEQRAISYSTFNGKNAYGTTLNGLSENFNEVFPKYVNSLINSKFNNSELNQEKSVTKKMLKSEKKDPTRMAFKKISNIIFEGHSYGLSQIGTNDSIPHIDVEKLKKLHNKNLKKSPIIFCYSGPESADSIKSQILSNIKLMPARKDKRKTSFKELTIKKESYTSLSFSREQTQIFYGFQTLANDQSEILAIKFLHAYLGGQSSKLFARVRDEKGLCYSVQPLFFNAMEGGYFGIFMGSSNEKVQEALVSIKDIFREIKNKGLSKKEFESTKKMILGQFEMSLQTNEDFIGIYGVPFLHGQPIDFYYEQHELIKKMKVSTLNRLLTKIFKRPSHTVLAGKKFKMHF